MANLNDSRSKVMSFIDRVNAENLEKHDMDDINNSVEVKLRKLNRCKEDAKRQCVDYLMSDVYKKAVPLSADYKTAYRDSMNSEFPNFIAKTYPDGLAYYIKECIKKSPFAKKITEAVDKFVDDVYADKEENIEDIDPAELVFRSSDEDNQRKLDIIGKDLNISDISDVINTNVQNSIISEVRRARDEKNKLKEFEDNLKNDPAINSKEAVEAALEMEFAKDSPFFTPTLFEGIMINKMNSIDKNMDVPNLYDAIKEYTNTPTESTIENLTFVESVKEYTCLNILKAFKFESFNPSDITRLAEMYAEA